MATGSVAAKPRTSEGKELARLLLGMVDSSGAARVKRILIKYHERLATGNFGPFLTKLFEFEVVMHTQLELKDLYPVAYERAQHVIGRICADRKFSEMIAALERCEETKLIQDVLQEICVQAQNPVDTWELARHTHERSVEVGDCSHLDHLELTQQPHVHAVVELEETVRENLIEVAVDSGSQQKSLLEPPKNSAVVKHNDCGATEDLGSNGNATDEPTRDFATDPPGRKDSPTTQDDPPAIISDEKFNDKITLRPFSASRHKVNKIESDLVQRDMESPVMPSDLCPQLGFYQCADKIQMDKFLVHLKEAHNIASHAIEPGVRIKIIQVWTPPENLTNQLVLFKPVPILLSDKTFFMRTKMADGIISWNVSSMTKEDGEVYYAQITFVPDETQAARFKWEGQVLVGLKNTWDPVESLCLPAGLIKGKSKLVLFLQLHKGKIEDEQLSCSCHSARPGATVPVYNVQNDILENLYRPKPALIGGEDAVEWATSSPKVHTIDMESGVFCLQHHGDNLVVGLKNGKIQIWDLSCLKLRKTLTGHTDCVAALQFNEVVIVSGSWDETVRFWDSSSGNCLREFALKAQVTDLILKSNLLVTIQSDGITQIWTVYSKKEMQPMRTLSGVSYAPMDFDGKYIVSTSPKHSIVVWSTTSGTLVRTLKGHRDRVRSIQLRDKYAVSGSYDCTVRVWNVKCSACLRILYGHQSNVYVRFDDKLIVTGSSDGDIKVWTMKKPRKKWYNFLNLIQMEIEETTDCLRTFGTKRWVECLEFDHYKIIIGSSHSNYNGGCINIISA